MSKSKNVVLAGLVAGAAAYLSKPENRDKVLEAVNVAKDKVTEIVNTKKTDEEKPAVETSGDTLQEQAKAAAGADSLTVAENEMVSEGAQTTVKYYNEKVDAKTSE